MTHAYDIAIRGRLNPGQQPPLLKFSWLHPFAGDAELRLVVGVIEFIRQVLYQLLPRVTPLAGLEEYAAFL
jgi:hypothetical protein